MASGQDHRRPRWNAGLALALLACVGLLLQGIVRLTHHHDAANSASVANHHGDVAAHDHHPSGKPHDDAACMICVALAMTAGAAPAALPLILIPAEQQRQCVDAFTCVAASEMPVAPWQSRAPPVA
jgi:hypothetical protein